MIFPLCFGPGQTFYEEWRAELGGNQRLLPSVETALAIDWQISTQSGRSPELPDLGEPGPSIKVDLAGSPYRELPDERGCRSWLS